MLVDQVQNRGVVLAAKLPSISSRGVEVNCFTRYAVAICRG